jgi:hypothetical protein
MPSLPARRRPGPTFPACRPAAGLGRHSLPAGPPPPVDGGAGAGAARAGPDVRARAGQQAPPTLPARSLLPSPRLGRVPSPRITMTCAPSPPRAAVRLLSKSFPARALRVLSWPRLLSESSPDRACSLHELRLLSEPFPGRPCFSSPFRAAFRVLSPAGPSRPTPPHQSCGKCKCGVSYAVYVPHAHKLKALGKTQCTYRYMQITYRGCTDDIRNIPHYIWVACSNVQMT